MFDLLTSLEFLVLVMAYLLGTFPLGLIWCKRKGIDLRAVGSGNIGATNVKRALGLGPAIVVFLFDVAKGWVSAGAALALTRDTNFALVAGFLAILGHCFPFYLKFKGGKGVATTLGVVLVIYLIPASLGFGAFFLVLVLTRLVSLGSLVGTTVFATTQLVISDYRTTLISLVGAALIFYLHRVNIRRLIEGTETKFTFGKGPDKTYEATEPEIQEETRELVTSGSSL